MVKGITTMKTAMRDADNKPVFVRKSGEYADIFPRENIVRRNDTHDTEFKVYGFVGTNDDYEEKDWTFSQERKAIRFATMLYGSTHHNFSKDGEVYEVEVHEIDAEQKPTVE